MNTSEHPDWQQDYTTTAHLHEQVQHYYNQISDRLDDEVLNHVEVDIKREGERVTVVCEQDEDAPEFEPTSGWWGTRALEHVHDVFVDAIQSAGRRLEYGNDMREACETGRLVMHAPKSPNPLEDD